METLVENMLGAIQNDTAAYNKFILEYNKCKNTSFYFIEGDDFCYYNSRIRKYSSNDCFKNYPCGGKSKVISVRNMISNSKIKLENNNKVMFFVDRDYNFEFVPEGIYITDWYSIENFYLTKELIKKVLENFFRLNEYDNNYEKALEYFEELYKEYSRIARKLNVFYYTVRECEKIQNTPKTKFATVPFYKFIEKNKLKGFKMVEYSYDELSKMYEISCKLSKELLVKNEHIFSENDHSNYRGKSELEFLKNFLDLIRRAMNSGSYGFEKIKVCKYDFQTDIMTILTDYAYTSKKLVEYISTMNIKEDSKPIQYV